MLTSRLGSVLDIAVRTRGAQVKVGPMRTLPRVTAQKGAGLAEDVACTDPRRGITLLSSGHWKDVVRELGADIPWHTRRANILIDAGPLGSLIGKTVRIGPVRLRIHDETRPCALMDRLHQGLRATLGPDCRAGVHGEILEAGEIQIGDEVVVEQ
jgi:MOSC domain-containing protein YiiM